MGQTYQVTAADVGLLIGLYLSPGLAIALPGSAIGKFFGDKRAVLAGLALMTLSFLLGVHLYSRTLPYTCVSI